MSDFRESERILKHHLKNKRRRTLALIVAFMVLGTPYFKEEALARDLRNRVKENNSINIESGDTVLKSSADGIDVVNISAPDNKGISHNRFIDLSVGAGNGIIFNNSTEHGQSQIGGYVLKNPNLSRSAKVILSEVTGNAPSNINGDVEIFGKKADFILANENGIVLNDTTFINTNGVTLTTGKVSINRSKFNFDVQKGEVILNGVESDGDYFNVCAKTIEIQKKIMSGEREKELDITMAAGENLLRGDSRDLGKVDIVSSKENQNEKYGIYGTSLGAMYGRNIKLISTDSGLGVKHDGLIFSTKDMEINSNGDIVLKDIKSQGTLRMSGKNVILENKDQGSGEDSKGKIVSTKDIDILATKDIVNNGMILGNGNISLTGKNIINNEEANIWTTKNLRLNAENKISNRAGSSIGAKEKMWLDTKEIESWGKAVKEDKKLYINTNSLVNKEVEKGSSGNDLIEKEEKIETTDKKTISEKTSNRSTKKKKVKLKQNEYYIFEEEIIRTEDEIKKQLDIILNSGKDIPEEHLHNFLAKVFLNKEARSSEGDGKKKISNELIMNDSFKDNVRLSKLYKMVNNDFEVRRKEMDNELVDSLGNNKELGDILFAKALKDEGSRKKFLDDYIKTPEKVLEVALKGEYMEKNDLLAMANIIQEARKPIFESYIGTEYKPAEIKVVEKERGVKGEHKKGKIRINSRELKTPVEALDTIMHETTHLEQSLIRKSKSDKIEEKVKELYTINGQIGGYIIPGRTKEELIMYKEQLMEAEAFSAMRGKDVILKNLIRVTSEINEGSYVKSIENSDQSEES